MSLDFNKTDCVKAWMEQDQPGSESMSLDLYKTDCVKAWMEQDQPRVLMKPL